MLNTVKAFTWSALGKIALNSAKLPQFECFTIRYQDSNAVTQLGCCWAKSKIRFLVIMCIKTWYLNKRLCQAQFEISCLDFWVHNAWLSRPKKLIGMAVEVTTDVGSFLGSAFSQLLNLTFNIPRYFKYLIAFRQNYF